MKAVVWENTYSLTVSVIVNSHTVGIGSTDAAVGFSVMSTHRFHWFAKWLKHTEMFQGSIYSCYRKFRVVLTLGKPKLNGNLLLILSNIQKSRKSRVNNLTVYEWVINAKSEYLKKMTEKCKLESETYNKMGFGKQFLFCANA